MQKISLLFTLLLMLFTSACNKADEVDLILKNATIYTVDNAFNKAEALAIKQGKIIAVGPNKEILAKYAAKQIIDLNGKYVYPGFIDAHAHFFGYGKGIQTEAPLYDTQSEEQILDLLAAFQKEKQNAWIIGRGWDQNDWPIAEFPTKKRLDKLFPKTPVYLIRIDGHAAWVNSKALELAGINSNTHVNGGEILLKNGESTGILIDNAMGLVRHLIPDPDADLKIKALKAAEKNCFAVGLTGVTDAGLSLDDILLIDKLQKSGELNIRLNVMLDPSKENFDYFVSKEPYLTDKLSVRTIKIYADGALGSRGACMLKPYSDDTNNSGLMIESENYYRQICSKALENNYQVATHAIGDSGNRVMLNIYGEFLKGKNDKRWRIEHAQIVAPEDFALFGKYSVIPSVQPTHATSDMYWAEERVGPERIKGAYAYRQLLKENGWIPLGTDFPIEKIDPLLTFYAAVVRKDLNNYPENGFQTENTLSRIETLKGMTIWAAKAAFEEHNKGSIEAGKFADLVVLDQDIMECEGAAIPKTRILYTIVNGTLVYQKK